MLNVFKAHSNSKQIILYPIVPTLALMIGILGILGAHWPKNAKQETGLGIRAQPG